MPEGSAQSVAPFSRVVALRNAQGETVQKDLDEISFALLQLYESNTKTWTDLQTSKVVVSEALQSQFTYLEGQRSALEQLLLSDKSFSERQWRQAHLEAQSFGVAVQQEFFASERKFQIVEKAHYATTARIDELDERMTKELKATYDAIHLGTMKLLAGVKTDMQGMSHGMGEAFKEVHGYFGEVAAALKELRSSKKSKSGGSRLGRASDLILSRGNRRRSASDTNTVPMSAVTYDLPQGTPGIDALLEDIPVPQSPKPRGTLKPNVSISAP